MAKLTSFTGLCVLLMLGVAVTAWEDYTKESEDSCDCSCSPNVRVMANNLQKVRYEDPPQPPPHHKPQPPKQLMCDMHYDLVTWEGGATCYINLDHNRYHTYTHDYAEMQCEHYFDGHLATYDTVHEFGAFKKWWDSKRFPYVYGRDNMVHVGGMRYVESTHFHKPNGDDYSNLGLLGTINIAMKSDDPVCLNFMEESGVLFLETISCLADAPFGAVCEQSPKYKDDFADHSYEAMSVEYAKEQAHYK